MHQNAVLCGNGVTCKLKEMKLSSHKASDLTFQKVFYEGKYFLTKQCRSKTVDLHCLQMDVELSLTLKLGLHDVNQQKCCKTCGKTKHLNRP